MSNYQVAFREIELIPISDLKTSKDNGEVILSSIICDGLFKGQEISEANLFVLISS